MIHNTSIKISHLVCVFPPYNGGIGVAALKQAKIGAKNNYNVSIYTPNYQKTGHIEEKKDNIVIYRIQPKFTIGKASGAINIKKYIKGINILHIHYPFYGSIIPAIRIAKKHKKKIILFWHMNPKAKGLKGLFFKLYEKLITPWILKNVDKILVSTKDYFASEKLYKKYQNKIQELPFSVSTEKFAQQEKNRELIKAYGLENKKILIFVGGLDKAHYFKGLDVLLKAMKRLNDDYKLIVVGSGELENYYKNLATKLKIENKVIFTGSLNGNELIKHYNLADVLILPSINQGEAFGIVQIEAMACAKPVIVSNLPGVRTVLKNNETGFTFKINDSNDLAEKIIELFKDKERLEIFSKNARQRVIENFSDKIISKKLTNIYRNLY